MSTQWICRKCGTRCSTPTKEKPGATRCGKCKGSNVGVHSWVKA